MEVHPQDPSFSSRPIEGNSSKQTATPAKIHPPLVRPTPSLHTETSEEPYKSCNQIIAFRSPNPNLKCQAHKESIILYCSVVDCPFRSYLCCKCISSELEHINLHTPSLLTPDEFWKYITSRSSCSENIIPLLKRHFHLDIDLGDLDVKIKSEFRNKLKDFEGAKKSEFQSQIDSNSMIQANLEGVSSLKNIKLIDSSLQSSSAQNILRSEKLSLQQKESQFTEFINQRVNKPDQNIKLKEYFEKSEAFYRHQVQKTKSHPPRINMNKLKKNLRKKLNQVKNKVLEKCPIVNSGIRDFVYVTLNVQNLEDLEKIGAYGIRPKTSLVLNLCSTQSDGLLPTNETLSAISRYPAQQIILTIKQGVRDLSPELFASRIIFFSDRCQSLVFDFENSLYPLQFLLGLLQVVRQTTQTEVYSQDGKPWRLKRIVLLLNKTSLNDEGLSQIIQILPSIVSHVKHFEIHLSGNNLSTDSLFLIEKLLSYCSENLQKLVLDLSCNQIQLGKLNRFFALSHLTNLREFSLDLESTVLGDAESHLMAWICEFVTSRNLNGLFLSLPVMDMSTTSKSFTRLIKKIVNTVTLESTQIYMSNLVQQKLLYDIETSLLTEPEKAQWKRGRLNKIQIFSDGLQVHPYQQPCQRSEEEIRKQTSEFHAAQSSTGSECELELTSRAEPGQKEKEPVLRQKVEEKEVEDDEIVMLN